MMMRVYYIIVRLCSRAICSAAVLVCALVLAAGCHRRPLEDPEYLTKVNVEVNIDNIQNVTCDIYNPAIPVPEIKPDAMHVIFFDKKGSVAAETFITDVTTAENGRRVISGEFSIAPGRYKMLIYDYGTDATLVKDYYSWENACAYTDPVAAYVKNQYSSKGEGVPLNILDEPEHLMVARNSNEVIPYHFGVHNIYAEARSVVESWYLQIKVDGLEYVTGAQALLGGMVGSNLIATDTRVEQPEAAIWFKMVKSEDNGTPVICAVFNTFGHIDGSDNDLEVTFDLVRTDGKKFRKTFNISELFASENAVRHHWLLLDETITIDPPKASGGYDPIVGDWDDEHREIDI